MPAFTPEHHTAACATEPGEQGILRYYAALQCASREMLEAARAGDWDSVCRLEGACVVVIARLRQEQRHSPLAPHEQPLRMRFLRAILANDAEIRRICEPQPQVAGPDSFSVGEVSLAMH